MDRLVVFKEMGGLSPSIELSTFRFSNSASPTSQMIELSILEDADALIS